MSETIPAPPTPPIPPTLPTKPVPPQKINGQTIKRKKGTTEGDKEKTTSTAPKQYEYSHTISHWGVLSKRFAGVASKSDMQNVSHIHMIIGFISAAIYVLLIMFEDFLTPAMRSSIYIFVLPFLIVLIPKSLPLLVRRVHAFGKSGLWVFGIIPFLIILVTYFLPLLVVVGASFAIDGSEGNMTAVAVGSVITGIATFVIGSIIYLIYLLYWLIKIRFSDAPVDIDERERKKSNILCGKTGLQIDKIQLSYKAARQTPSDNSEHLFKTTAGKWIFAASVVLCSIPLIYQFTPRQIVVQDSHFQSDKEKENEDSVQLQKTEEENNSLLTNDDSERTPKINNPFVKAGTDINKTDGKVQTRLYRAALEGQTEVVKLLIEAGADVNKADNDGATPLHAAAVEGHTEVAKVLIEVGADVNKVDNDGVTPLHWAAFEGPTELVKLLIAAGADVNKANKYGESPLSYAAQGGQTEVAKVLIEVGADVNKANKFGESPLRYAAKLGHTEVAKVLIEAGAKM